MQLCYRGIPYHHNPLQVKTKPGARVIRFLGASTPAQEIDFSQPAVTEEGQQYQSLCAQSQRKLRFLGKPYNHTCTTFIPTNPNPNLA